jgi:hypothetical protein
MAVSAKLLPHIRQLVVLRGLNMSPDDTEGSFPAEATNLLKESRFQVGHQNGVSLLQPRRNFMSLAKGGLLDWSQFALGQFLDSQGSNLLGSRFISALVTEPYRMMRLKAWHVPFPCQLQRSDSWSFESFGPLSPLVG